MNALSPLLSRDDLFESEFEEDQVFEESEPVIAVTRDPETGYVSVVLNERASRALTAVMNCIDDDCLSEKYDYSWDAEQVLARLRAAL
ncbi:hypothetical protein LWF15_24595 [Kineosporia rhizophila]|uniref:hypothetical protein n=1 Tax=Kineosporia TaxID=49184 RepID=UPI000A6014D8|nr:MULTISPECIES: hypothetical protein [Kineosporia]MCE0538682.1 hypothetical protein [Kineosporia rhizophila]GLY19460.1 hypothetical protein Kisp01_64740 [Kineosporia sp. NBRC 101677]